MFKLISLLHSLLAQISKVNTGPQVFIFLSTSTTEDDHRLIESLTLTVLVTTIDALRHFETG